MRDPALATASFGGPGPEAQTRKPNPATPTVIIIVIVVRTGIRTGIRLRIRRWEYENYVASTAMGLIRAHPEHPVGDMGYSTLSPVQSSSFSRLIRFGVCGYFGYYTRPRTPPPLHVPMLAQT